MTRRNKETDLIVLQPLDASRLGKDQESVSAEIDRLREKLRRIGDVVQRAMNDSRYSSASITKQGVPDLNDLETLHFMSVSIIPSDREGIPGQVVLELSVDESREEFLKALVNLCRKELIDEAFKYCEGYDQSASDRKCVRWLRNGVVKSPAFYNGHIGRSRNCIRLQAKFQKEVSAFVKKKQSSASSRAELWNLVREQFRSHEAVRNKPSLPWNVSLFFPDIRRKWGFRIKFVAKYGALLLGLYEVFYLRTDWTALLNANFNAVRGGFTGFEQAMFFIVPAIVALIAGTLWFSEYPAHVTRRHRYKGILKASWKGVISFVSLLAFAGFIAFIFRIVWEAWVLVALGTIGLVLAVFVACVVLTAFSRFLGTFFAAILVVLALATLVSPWRALFTPGIDLDVFVHAKQWTPFIVLTFAIPLLLLLARMINVRRSELHDKSEPVSLDARRMTRMRARENQQVHSHFIATAKLRTSPVKNCGMPFRQHTLLVAFRILTVLHKIYLTQGWLGTISSIHFARWMLIENGTRILFLTNYDGGFAAYLGAFSENPGTTAIFGNVQGFPKPYFLIGDGARREPEFIDFARSKQCESLIWYSAYPDLTVMDINRHTQLCRTIPRPPEDNLRGFFAELRRIYSRSISEAEIREIVDTIL